MLIDHIYKLYRWYQLISMQTPWKTVIWKADFKHTLWTPPLLIISKNSSLPEHFLPSPENE